MLPIYPFVVYLCSVLLSNGQYRGVKVSIGISATLFILILPATIILKDKVPDLFDSYVIVYTAIAILAGAGAVALICLYRNHVFKAFSRFLIPCLICPNSSFLASAWFLVSSSIASWYLMFARIRPLLIFSLFVA